MRLNVPNKLIEITVNSVSGTEFFQYANGTGDRWWENGTSPKFYRWEIVASVTTQDHGSHLTREPFEYNGLDIYVGDWIAKTNVGAAFKIVSVESKTESDVTLIVEDEYRYNTFRSSLGDAGLNTGPYIAFSVSPDNLPLIDPLPSIGIGSTFLGNIISRFQSFNERNIFQLQEQGHSFIENDLVAMSGGQFVIAGSNSYDKLVGTVINPGPGPDNFLIQPFNTIHEGIFPALPGSKGDIIYVDDTTGTYTTTVTEKPVYLQLSDAVATEIDGSAINPTVTVGEEIEINDVVVTFSGTSLASAVTNINAASGTNVTASAETTETVIQNGGGSATLFYGIIGADLNSTNPQATINGTTVTFSTTTDGAVRFGPGFASGIDFAEDINNAGITNITASAASNNSTLTITETSGGAITITNVTNDSQNTPWAGPSSCSAIPLSTSASTSEFLRLTRSDGGEIILTDITGTPKDDLGIESAQNGIPPIGLVIEQGIRKGDTYVVADITARNALTPLIGDIAYVLDSGQGEWTLYIWDGGQWIQLTDEDASDVDAQTLSVNATYTSGSPILIGSLSDGARITSITVDVTVVWDDPAATLTVGDSVDNTRFMSTSLNDLTTLGTYYSSPAFQYNTGGIETEVSVYLSSGTATQGSATVTISYI